MQLRRERRVRNTEGGGVFPFWKTRGCRWGEDAAAFGLVAVRGKCSGEGEAVTSELA